MDLFASGRVWWPAFKLTFPLDPENPVSFTRPLYPYPMFARYNGTGDPNAARNFVPVTPGAGFDRGH